ncbi:hypothetical protein IO99_12890 [Clostridium sulfidigenes]|uniref:Uncharacterized protein n=1 Tax=Clostridium sulfidigenes TaxID=318464 RepID=A0A084JA11_9CLOT|nr:hypothetical protein [Clostridium sulfidigenes]KEZ85795.1 hypothetical protein IO99_12890 [Clostridium sulfidigenes]
MDTRVPYHNYIVVTPNGDVLGFGEEDDARKYVAGYYVGKIEELSDDRSKVYVDYGTDPLQASVDICTELGAYEGDCIIYDLDSFIENIQSSGIFEDEKEELILNLMQEKINLNINDYQVDDLLYDTKVVPNRD